MRLASDLGVNFATDSSLVIVPFSVRCGDGRELSYFLNVQKVLAVAEATGLAPVPGSLAPFCGLHDMGGTPVPVLDLGAWLAGTPGTASEAGGARPRRLILCQTLERTLGLLVAGTRKVRRQPNAAIVPPPAAGDAAAACVSGVVKGDDGFHFMLDLEALFLALGLAASAASDAPHPATLAGKRVLVVDDSRLYQTLVATALSRYGAKVDVAGDGREGLRLALAASPAHDLLVVDVEMPLMNGVEMVRAYRRAAPRIAPVLFHSAITNPVLAADLAAEGLGEYVPKFDEEAITGRILQLLEAAR